MFNESIDNMEELCNNVDNTRIRPSTFHLKSDAERGAFLFEKPFLSTSEKIALLKKRGLCFTEEEEGFIANILETVGYYRLSGYFHFYYRDDLDDPTQHIFRQNTRFTDVYTIYKLDEQVRQILLDALFKIEISLKTRLDLELCNLGKSQNDPFPELWYLKEAYFKDAKDFANCFHKICKDMDFNAKEPRYPFIASFNYKYEDQFPPSWMLVETLMFGTLSKVIEKLKAPIRKKLAKQYGYEIDKDFVKAVNALGNLRNIAAHHGRVWNREFGTVPPVIYAFDEFRKNAQDGKHDYAFSNKRLAHFYLIIRYMHRSFSEELDFTERFKVWYERVPNDLRSHLGFRHPIEYYDKYFNA
jgi:abortive infection bacteriophage resistance protein